MSCCNNGCIIHPENPPQKMGFIKVSEKESKNGKKPHIIIDQANYLKYIVLSLSCTEIPMV